MLRVLYRDMTVFRPELRCDQPARAFMKALAKLVAASVRIAGIVAGAVGRPGDSLFRRAGRVVLLAAGQVGGGW